MRSVCGCMPASSAATEMTYTALVRSTAMSHPQVRSWRLGGRRGQLLDRRPLLVRGVLGHRHLDGDQQVPGAVARRGPLALHLEGAAGSGPRRDPDGDRLLGERGDLDVAAQ